MHSSAVSIPVIGLVGQGGSRVELSDCQFVLTAQQSLNTSYGVGWSETRMKCVVASLPKHSIKLHGEDSVSPCSTKPGLAF